MSDAFADRPPPWVQEACLGHWRESPSGKWPTEPGWPPSLADLRSKEGHRLLSYQIEGIKFGLKNGGRVLIGDEMGLGKTVQALALAAHYLEEWPMLIVCPASVGLQWHEEAVEWLPDLCVSAEGQAVQVLTKGADRLQASACIYIVSYRLLAENLHFQRRPDGSAFCVIVADEAHYLKSPTSARTRTIAPLLSGARRAILLTGTAAVNNAAELHTPLQCLLPRIVPSWKEFVQRYCEKHEVLIKGRGKGKSKCITKWEGSSRPQELHSLLRETIMVRRLKAEILEELPEKRRQLIKLDARHLDQAAMKQIKVLMKQNAEACAALKACMETGQEVACAGFVTQMAHLTCQAKQKAVQAYVEYLVEAGCRFLLFAHHICVLDYLEDTLKKSQVQYIRIDGGVSSTGRHQLAQQFQHDSSIQVALLSITACGQGLNFQSVSTLVFAEFYWVVGQMLQAEDRIHRIGQRVAANIHYLAASGTLDDFMYGVLRRKYQDTTATLDGAAKKLEVNHGSFAPEAPATPRRSPQSSNHAPEDVAVEQLTPQKRKKAQQPSGDVEHTGEDDAGKSGLQQRKRGSRGPDWSREEEQKFIVGYQLYGTSWQTIQNSCGLEHRSTTQIENKCKNMKKQGCLPEPPNRAAASSAGPMVREHVEDVSDSGDQNDTIASHGCNNSDIVAFIAKELWECVDCGEPNKSERTHCNGCQHPQR
jgi:superfamily II DNA or RNA helicase